MKKKKKNVGYSQNENERLEAHSKIINDNVLLNSFKFQNLIFFATITGNF